MSAPPIDFAAVNSAALAALPSLLPRWLPDGRRAGNEWVARNPRREDRRPGSFSINTVTGCWSDFATGDSGSDPVSLAAYLFGIGQAEAARLVQELLGQAAPPRKDGARPDRTQKWLADKIAEIWSTATVIDGTGDTVAERYFRDVRGITARLPPTIRSTSALYHGDTKTWLAGAVLAIQAPDRKVVAVHRTYLTGQGRKAPVSSPKMALGPVRGNAIRFAPAAGRMVVCEGPEDAMSILQATGLPVWSAVSAGNLQSMWLPPDAREIVIAADRGMAGEQSADKAAGRWADEGRTVRIALPPPGMDYNDMLRDGAAIGDMVSA